MGRREKFLKNMATLTAFTCNVQTGNTNGECLKKNSTSSVVPHELEA
jgi:hypothetical protein